jgi:hypothetical protein
MTRQELKDAIHARGVEFKSGLTKAELQVIYNKLHVHKTPQRLQKLKEAGAGEAGAGEAGAGEAGEAGAGEAGAGEAGEAGAGEAGAGEAGEAGAGEAGEAGAGGAGAGEAGEAGAGAAGEFDELLGKIGSASAPEPSTFTGEKPLFEKTRRKKKKGESSPDSFRVEGYVLLLVTDTIFPFAFAFINNALDKRVKVQADELQLADKDFAKLEPLADQAADYMSINLNPIAGFFLVAAFMYSNNLIMIRTSKEPK